MDSMGVEILVETARLWASLGFFTSDDRSRFEIHGVTGPDEYTTVVNNNFYTNVMAKFNLAYAAEQVDRLRDTSDHSYEILVRRTGIDAAEVDLWRSIADAMYLPFDPELGIHPQDDSFLELEPWPEKLSNDGVAPLLQQYHPLVIYRHQVLKMADVVMAMHLQASEFDQQQMERNFSFYDPITTGDSSLSASVQAIVAARVNYVDEAHAHFEHALYLDLLDLHGGTPGGVHVANAGGVWLTIAHGFLGLRDDGETVSVSPRLPRGWESLTVRLNLRGSRVAISTDGQTVDVQTLDGSAPEVIVNL
jgi:alpha,alpha-trehalose phosphorylase